jgi:hypothetical protein
MQYQRTVAESDRMSDGPGLFRRWRLRLPVKYVRHVLSNVRDWTTLFWRGLRVRRNLVSQRLLQRQHVRPCCQPNGNDVWWRR